MSEFVPKMPIVLAGQAFGRKYHCATRGKEIEGFDDRLSAEEFRISGMCQACQNEVFNSKESEE